MSSSLSIDYCQKDLGTDITAVEGKGKWSNNDADNSIQPYKRQRKNCRQKVPQSQKLWISGI